MNIQAEVRSYQNKNSQKIFNNTSKPVGTQNNEVSSNDNKINKSKNDISTIQKFRNLKKIKRSIH